jgi:anionic cell wall polymer biosynthesis LytR-Cps2A-Psr (LCP) family protein
MKNLNSTLSSPLGSKSHQKFFHQHKKHLIFSAILLIVIGFMWSSGAKSPVLQALGQNNAIEEQGRVNILLLGIGGTKHDGPNLTDTIILASYDQKTKKVDLISLPRDLWLEKYKAKVNTMYQLGLNKGGDGLDFVQTEIGDVLGVTIPYTVRVDFNGFVKAVDLVEGLDLNVQKTFDDYEYPIEGKEDDLCGYKEQTIDVDEDKSKELNIPQGKQKVYLAPDGSTATDSAKLDYSCRFEHLHFDAGPTHMDGVTALKFVRSRHGTGSEGSDFARSKRQQLVLQAFREKVLSLGTLTDPGKVISLLQTFGSSIATDIPQDHYLSFLKMAKDVSGFQSHVIDLDADSHLLINPPPNNYGGAWVLIPPNNDFSGVHTYVQTIFNPPIATPSASVSASPTQTPKGK